MNAAEEVDDDSAGSGLLGRLVLAEEAVGQKDAEARTGVGLEHVHNGLASGLGLLGCDGNEYAVADCVVEEQYLSGLDEDSKSGQQVRVDHRLDAGLQDPAVMVTHIGGLDAAAETTCNLPGIPGGKKLIYTHISMPLVGLDELRDRADEDERYAGLADIVDANNGLWCPEAERYLLTNWAE